MKIMNLSIEEYQQWLQSKPSIAQVLAYGNRTIDRMVAAIERIKSKLGAGRKRSCLSPMARKTTVLPFDYNKTAAEQDQTTYAFRSGHSLWTMYIQSESAYTRIRNIVNAHCDIEMDLIDSLTYAKN